MNLYMDYRMKCDEETKRLHELLAEAENKIDRLEWENKGIAEWRDIALEREQQLITSQKQNALLRECLRDIRDNFDCDSDAHKYGTPCRCCSAKEALAATTAMKESK